MRNGVASQEMAQYINALAQDAEKSRAWIGATMKESQSQAQVLRQHEMGQHAIAGVIKSMMRQQPHNEESPQQTGVTTAGPVVTVIEEDGDVLNFSGESEPKQWTADNPNRADDDQTAQFRDRRTTPRTIEKTKQSSKKRNERHAE